MLNFRFLVLLPVLILGLFCGCDDDGVGPDPYDSHFPNEIGYHWEYVTYDSVSQVTDRVDVRIVDEIVHFGDTVKVWRFDWGDRIDTAYVAVDNDSVKVFDRNGDIERLYIIPFELDETWENEYLGLTHQYEVTEKLYYPTNGGTAGEGYVVNHQWNAFEFTGNVDRYFSRGIGMYRMHSNTFNGTVFTNEVWNLDLFQRQ